MVILIMDMVNCLIWLTISTCSDNLPEQYTNHSHLLYYHEENFCQCCTVKLETAVQVQMSVAPCSYVCVEECTTILSSELMLQNIIEEISQK